MIDLNAYHHCTLCPRQCAVDRRIETGICGQRDKLRIASIGAHHGEEPPISGTNGSGTVFLAGCSLRCRFCQNYDISCLALGDVMSIEHAVLRLESLVQNHGVHNINFVTPDHFLPHIVEIVNTLRAHNMNVPVVYNTSGFTNPDMVDVLADIVDIYMPDFKFADADLAGQLANAPDYPEVAIKALTKMAQQKGFLGTELTQRVPATRGVLVRHLVLPGHIDNSLKSLDLLHRHFGVEIPINIMAQYWPARRHKDTALNRRLTSDEYQTVVSHAKELNFVNILTQTLY